MKKRKMRKRIIWTIVIIVFLLGCFYLGKRIYTMINTFNVKVVDKIDNYPYVLDDRDTELFKTNYNELKSLLKNQDVDEEAYAKLVTKLFIIDLYTLDNKVNKYDIGGLEFIYPEAVDNYKLKVQDTIYKYIVDNTNKKRNQQLPVVSKIDIEEVKNIDYKIGDKSFKAYQVSLSWDYEKDLEYDKKGQAIVVKQDNVLYVAEYKNN